MQSTASGIGVAATPQVAPVHMQGGWQVVEVTWAMQSTASTVVNGPVVAPTALEVARRRRAADDVFIFAVVAFPH
eukprot:CAMPEP_0197843314 /NCGR_PEP_ID=MMETSP1438-20131217/166_1 /TAXON_ID=1461541 /ORGANISM="Pterosperma sp., Strain CCMP1384" /LENGTH=74 /DNA_ID=CAMNT_0043453381 /DNA_START=18 /DNA_END=242 /DNA_ORIENTATION=-